MKEAFPVRYHPLFGILFVLAAAFEFVVFLVTSQTTMLVLGLVQACLGVLLFTRPMFSLERDHLAIRNLFGMTLRKYEFRSRSELEIRDDAVYRKGAPEKLVARGFARKDDWEAFVAALKN